MTKNKAPEITKSGLRQFAKKGLLTERQEEILTAWLYTEELRNITLQEVAKRIHVSRSKVYQAMREDNPLRTFKYETVLELLALYNEDVSKKSKPVGSPQTKAEKEKINKIIDGLDEK